MNENEITINNLCKYIETKQKECSYSIEVKDAYSTLYNLLDFYKNDSLYNIVDNYDIIEP